MTIRTFGSWLTWDDAQADLAAILPAATVATLERAYAFAARWHEGQTRPAGEPYVTHLLEVLEIAFRQAGVTEPAALVAALLHDVVEDTPCTLDEVRAQFGAEAAELVAWLTKPEPGPGQSAQEARAGYLARFPDAPAAALTVKLSDRYSNVQRLHEYPPPDKRRRYFAETRDTFLPLAAGQPAFAELFAAWHAHYVDALG